MERIYRLSVQVADGTNGNDRDEGDEEIAGPVHEAESPLKADSSNFGGVPTYTSSRSLADYFAEKMKQKTLAQRDEVGTVSVDSSGVDIITELSVSQKAKKKSKKRKLAEVEGQMELNGQEEVSEKSQFIYQISEYPDSNPDHTTKPKLFEHGNKGLKQTAEYNSKDSDDLSGKLATVTFTEKLTKKKKCKKQKTKSHESSFTEITSPDCEVKQGTCVGENLVVTASSSARCNSSKLDVAVIETINAEDHATGGHIVSKSDGSFQSSNCSHKERPQSLPHQEATNSSQSVAVTSNNCQSKKTLKNLVSNDTLKHRAEQTSDLEKLWRYEVSRKKNFSHSPVTYNSTNTESWASVLKSARKQAPYRDLESKFQKHEVLSTTNLLYMSGYGVSLFE